MNLSGSTNGKPIQITGAGTTLHTATSSTTPGAGGTWDEVWLWITYNNLIGTPSVTIRFGNTTSPDHIIKLLPGYQPSPRLIVAGLMLQNSLVVSALSSATTSGNVSIGGFVNRITN